MKKSNILLIIVIVLLLALIGYVVLSSADDREVDDVNNPDLILDTVDNDINDRANVNDENDEDDDSNNRGDRSVIGTSVNGNDITAYHFGDGDEELLLVAGIHGGYSWNTSLLAYDLIDYLEDSEGELPDDLTVTVIPTLNPDGLQKVTGEIGIFQARDVNANDSERSRARFNANNVDLNRNFACDWQPEGIWAGTEVDAGSSAFSEPEAQALRGYINNNNVTEAIVYYAAAGGVYSSACGGSASAASNNLMNVYANASGYPAEGQFDAYELSGDAVNWMAREGINGISVLLTNYSNPETAQNRAGLQAIIDSLAN